MVLLLTYCVRVTGVFDGLDLLSRSPRMGVKRLRISNGVSDVYSGAINDIIKCTCLRNARWGEIQTLEDRNRRGAPVQEVQRLEPESSHLPRGTSFQSAMDDGRRYRILAEWRR